MSDSDQSIWEEFSLAVDQLKEAKDRWKDAKKTGKNEAAAEMDFRKAQSAYDKIADRI